MKELYGNLQNCPDSPVQTPLLFTYGDLHWQVTAEPNLVQSARVSLHASDTAA